MDMIRGLKTLALVMIWSNLKIAEKAFSVRQLRLDLS
jgi:hypothetical protein